MKINKYFIFTILGNAIDNIKESYIDEKNTVHVPLRMDLVKDFLLDDDKNLNDDYVIYADFSRQGLVNIYAENVEEDSEIINLIDSDELYDYLEFTNTEYIFRVMCNNIYTSEVI